MTRDPDNPTMNGTSLEDIEAAMPFLRQKYRPKVLYLMKHFKEPLAHLNVLDVGIGYGAFLAYIRDSWGMRASVGMDPHVESIKIAGKLTDAPLFKRAIEDESWEVGLLGGYDVITCLDVLEHLKQPSWFFLNAKKYLAPGGLVIVSTPLKSLGYHLRRLPYFGIKDTDLSHISVSPPWCWRELAIAAGYEIVDDWNGEHLAHVRGAAKLDRFLKRHRIDPRKIPILKEFEQSYMFVARVRRT